MGYDERSNFQGLMTAIGETVAPPGALRVANNVVIRRVGALEPREGILPKSFPYSLAGLQFRDAVGYDSETLMYASDGWRNSAGTVLKFNSADISQHPLPYAPDRKRLDVFSQSKLRGNLYLPASDGCVVIGSSSDAEWGEAGIFVSRVSLYLTDSIQIIADPAGSLPANYKWAYRLVLKDTRENGLIVRSRPTGAFYARNTVSVAGNPNMAIAVRSMKPTESVEVYRGRLFPIGIQTDDEMALVAEIFYDSFTHGIPLDFHFFLDTIDDSDRGRALYTSPSQGGIESANDLPPASAVTETFKGCLFFADINGPARVVFSYQYGVRNGSATGVGTRALSGSATIGTNQILGATPTTGLQVGMVQVGGAFASSSYIVSIVGTTITMSSNAALTYSGNFTFTDAVEIDGRWSPLSEFGSGTAASITNGGNNPNYGGLFGSYAISPPRPGYSVTLVVEKWLRDVATFSVRATHGDEMNPPIPLPGVNPALESSQDIYPNGFIWASTDEPEHVPPKNFALISERTARILGAKATRDSLFFFKEDGIYRLSGTREQWQIDPFDLTTFCILPSSIQRLDGRIYMLSNKGVVVVDDTGVSVISDVIADQVEKLVDDVRSNFAALGYYKLSGVEGVAACVDDRNSEYILLTGSTELDVGGKALRFSARSGTWTTLSSVAFTPYAAGVAVDNAPMLMQTAGVYASSYSKLTFPPDSMSLANDGNAGVTLLTSAWTDANQTTVTATISTAATVSIGDFLLISGVYYRVLTFIGSSVYTLKPYAQVLPPTSTLGAIYHAIECTVQPHGFVRSRPTGKLWSRLHAAFGKFLGPHEASVSFSGASVALPEDQQETEEFFAFYSAAGLSRHSQGVRLNSVVSQAHARAWLLRAKISWFMTYGRVSLEAVGIESREEIPGRSLTVSTGTT